MRKSSCAYTPPVFLFYERYVHSMKRVKAACICQTLHFMLKDDLEQEQAVRLVKEELANYKRKLEQNRTQYKILEESPQPDGSIIVKVIKQYNATPVGDYLK